jgi:thioredoxin reductase
MARHALLGYVLTLAGLMLCPQALSQEQNHPGAQDASREKAWDILRTSAQALIANKDLEAIILRNRKTGEEQTFKTRWLFVCIGGLPHTEWAVEAGVSRDQAGYLLTGPGLTLEGIPIEGWPLDRSPSYLETNVPGLFAASDVRHGSVKRCASAVCEGAMAVTFVHRYWPMAKGQVSPRTGLIAKLLIAVLEQTLPQSTIDRYAQKSPW